MDTMMVQMGLPVSGSTVPDAVLPGMGKADGLPLKQIAKAVSDPNPVAEQVAYDKQQSDKTRLENMQKATQIFKDIYAVSDTRFSIYKDFTGQYITRITSLRDGSVTYIPEQDMMEYLERSGKARKALLRIDV